MAAYQTLLTYYLNVMRVTPATMTPSELSVLQVLARDADGGGISMEQARIWITGMAGATTSVANLSYQFFTGATPKLGGLDYLVSPGGPNPNNLNSAYYQSFNFENRYINFAVNLGKGGEGAARFAADYGALSLSAATAKAYAQIFGVTPDAAKLSALLDTQVPNGQGGSYTRADYFASYGGDGLTGMGTKAAMVGWLLTAAAKEGVGLYAMANAAFLDDLSFDGMAKFNVDLVGAYGPQPTSPPGAALTIAANQSVSLTQSTPNADKITGSAGLDAGQSVAVGDGNDTVNFNISGVVRGSLDLGAGNDIIAIGRLEAVAGVAGSGRVDAGAGNDGLTIVNGVGAGAVVDGGAGWDGLYTQSIDPSARVLNVERIDISGAVYNGTFLDPNDRTNLVELNAANLVGTNEIWNLSRGDSSLSVSSVGPDVVLGLQNTTGGLFAFYTGVENAEIHLDNVVSVINVVQVSNLTGRLTINMDSDSRIGSLLVQQTRTVVIKGLGAFTAESVQIGYNIGSIGNPSLLIPLGYTLTFDASAAVQVNIGVLVPMSKDNVAILSGGDDTLGLDLSHAVSHTLTLGGGSDTLKINSATSGGVTSAQFSNVGLFDGKLTSYATVTDFQKGVDHLDLGARITSQATGLQAFVGNATTLEQALANVSSHVAVGAFGVFEFGGASYVYRQDGNVGLTEGDGLIKLTGAVGLTVGTGSTVAEIHYG